MEHLNAILILVAGVLLILGIIGSFLPIIPDVTLSFAGIVVYKFSNYCHYSWFLVLLLGLITVFALAADYLIPAWGGKRFGGSKWGIWGCVLGLIIGSFFLPPFGSIIGCFVGAVSFEILFDKQALQIALKAGFGSFLGFFSAMLLSFIISVGFFLVFLNDALPMLKTFL